MTNLTQYNQERLRKQIIYYTVIGVFLTLVAGKGYSVVFLNSEQYSYHFS